MVGQAILIETLKNNLKARGVTYKILAQKWKLSEASVKRIMSEGDLTLSRISQACDLMSMTFAELMKLTPFESDVIDQTYLPIQEEEFAKEIKLYHFWELLVSGNTIKQIEKKYIIEPIEVQKFLLKLDHLKLIELHPKNRVKILEQNRKLFRKDGPMGKLLVQQAKTNFLDHPFKNTLLEHLRFTIYRLHPQSAIRYKAKIDKLIFEMKSESEIEAHGSESVEFGLLAALRPWHSPLLQAIQLKK